MVRASGLISIVEGDFAECSVSTGMTCLPPVVRSGLHPFPRISTGLPAVTQTRLDLDYPALSIYTGNCKTDRQVGLALSPGGVTARINSLMPWHREKAVANQISLSKLEIIYIASTQTKMA
jgi:hypothetical protein